MPDCRLWLLNHNGSAFTLSTSQQKFRVLENTWDDSVTVKRVAASHWCAWAIGHDHRVYIYVLSSDVPIRVPETTYENQRWIPFHGFSKAGLLATDRFAWSDECGLVYRPKENVRLPSAHWEWENDWGIDENLRGEVVGIEGWQYALDFPSIYTPDKQWKSCVRKRKWIRFRRFSSTDTWARISDMEVVEKAECFIDVSVGGFLLPSQSAGFLSVWAITNNGNVYVRTNVNYDNPEGSTWQEVEIPESIGIINISVGASNLVWAITWDGHALVRENVTRTNIYGCKWIVVEYPNNSTRLMQVSVGKDAVWALSRDGKVWFRKGTYGGDMFWTKQSAVGTSWIEMVGEMSQITVSSNDQVFAIGMESKAVYFRTGVTSSDLTGKTWQQINLKEDFSVLEQHGLLSEGHVCYCDDPSMPCTMHDARPRLSSTTTSCSSISLTTNTEDGNSDAPVVFPSNPFAPSPSSLYGQGSLDTLQWTQHTTSFSFHDNENVDSESLLYKDQEELGADFSTTGQISLSAEPSDDDVKVRRGSLAEGECSGLKLDSVTFSVADSPSLNTLIASTSTMSHSSSTNSEEVKAQQPEEAIGHLQFANDLSEHVCRASCLAISTQCEDVDHTSSVTLKTMDSIALCDLKSCEVEETRLFPPISGHVDSDAIIQEVIPKDLSELSKCEEIMACNNCFEQSGSEICYGKSSTSLDNIASTDISSYNSSTVPLLLTSAVITTKEDNAEKCSSVCPPSYSHCDVSSCIHHSDMTLSSVNYSHTPSVKQSKKTSKSRRPKKLDNPSNDEDSIVFKSQKKRKKKKSTNDSLSTNEDDSIDSLDLSLKLNPDSVRIVQCDKASQEQVNMLSQSVSCEGSIFYSPSSSIDLHSDGCTKKEICSLDCLPKLEEVNKGQDLIDGQETIIKLIPSEVSHQLDVLRCRSNSKDGGNMNSDPSMIFPSVNAQSTTPFHLSTESLSESSLPRQETDQVVKALHHDSIPLEQSGCSSAPLEDKLTDSSDHNILNTDLSEKARAGLKKNGLEFMDRPSSLDSTSDEIIDFVTDLISDCDLEESDGKEVVSTIEELAECDQYPNKLNSEMVGDMSYNSKKSVQASNSEMVGDVSYSSKKSEQASDVPHIEQKSVDQSRDTSQNSVKCHSSSYSPSRKESTGDWRTVENGHSPTLLVQTHQSISTVPLSEQRPAGKVSYYSRNSSPSYDFTTAQVPSMCMTTAQPRTSWKWLDATSCVIDDYNEVEWLSPAVKVTDKPRRAINVSRHLREDIMRKIVQRNYQQVHRFKDMERAINQGSWVKKASMHVYVYDRNRWIDCNVELEKTIGSQTEGFLTVHYHHKRKQKHYQIAFVEMTCVKIDCDPDLQSAFTVYTSMTNIIYQPLKLKASSVTECEEWVGILCAANANAWNLNQAISPGAIWSCTFTGDVFISPATTSKVKPFDLCWGQHGGHLGMVETGPSGVTWGLGFDKRPYVYNKGFGGAVNAGQTGMSDNTQQLTDSHKVFVYEKEKWFPVVGWCSKGVFSNDFHWITEQGKSISSKDAVKLPSTKWYWISDWAVDFTASGGVDSNGWQYSRFIEGPFHHNKYIRDQYRRRRWVRHCRLTVLGPWQTAGFFGLIDLSIQIDPLIKDSDPVVLWAVGANGEVLYRHGVTVSNPLGTGWIHVATDLDKPFKSISVGGNYRVWGIASDGSAWFRAGVTDSNPAGKCWLQVVPPPPGNYMLHQLSVGATAVWAVDVGGNLWRRENITPTFPEGTAWDLVENRVKRVSVGPSDQVWIIADANFTRLKHGPGVIYSRVGITSSKPSGTDWEIVIGCGWAYVSVRGITEDKSEVQKPSQEKETWEK